MGALLVEEWVYATVFEAVGAAAALWGAFGLKNANRLVRDPRLERLAWFFFLMAAAAVIHVVGVLVFESAAGGVRQGTVDANDVLFWLHHAALVAALAMAVAAMENLPRPAAAIGPVLLVAEPLLRIVEALAFLYLVFRTTVNQMRKASMGSLRSAVGFFAIFAGQALFLFNRGQGALPLGARDPLAEALVALGLGLLALSIPRGRKTPA